MAVLVVDDSDSIRAELVELLKRENFEVFQAADGQSGFEVFQSEKKIKTIITDYHMPRLNGLEMIEKIKGSGRIQPVNVFMLTTESGEDLKRKSRELGIRYWMVKPIQSDALVSVMRKLKAE